MTTTLNRRRLIQTAAAAPLAALLPKAIFSQGTGSKKAVIHAEIGQSNPTAKARPIKQTRIAAANAAA